MQCLIVRYIGQVFTFTQSMNACCTFDIGSESIFITLHIHVNHLFESLPNSIEINIYDAINLLIGYK